MPRAKPTASCLLTTGRTEFLEKKSSTAMPRMVTPRQVWMMSVGRAKPSMAPTMEQAEAMRATGRARRRLAKLRRSRPGPAARAPARATSRPAPRTKSRWKGKKPETSGTKSTPPPTPAITAMMPRMKQKKSSATGQNHHGWLSTTWAVCTSPVVAATGEGVTAVSWASATVTTFVWAAGAVAAASAAMLMAGQARTKVRKNRTSHCPAVALTARAVVASALRAM